MDEKINKLKTAMQKLGVVPDVIQSPFEDIIEVTYPDNITVEYGNTLTPTQVKNKPLVKWNFEPEAFYTLMMIDPDAPTKTDPRMRDWQHWLVGNILENDVKNAETLSEYIGAGPPKDTGFHRYIFLVYKQSRKLRFNEAKLTNKSGQNRPNFSIKKFAAKYKLGDPIAGNFFLAEYDDYVPKLYKQISG